MIDEHDLTQSDLPDTDSQGVDTNIPIRLVTKSPPPMLEAARTYFEALERSPEPPPLMVHPARICEAIFVLEGKI